MIHGQSKDEILQKRLDELRESSATTEDGFEGKMEFELKEELEDSDFETE